jgi:hypothetical protein
MAWVPSHASGPMHRMDTICHAVARATGCP